MNTVPTLTGLPLLNLTLAKTFRILINIINELVTSVLEERDRIWNNCPQLRHLAGISW